MPTAVVCDDDRTVRAAVSAVCVDAGLEVVAETDSGADAAEMVRRFRGLDEAAGACWPPDATPRQHLLLDEQR